MENLGVYIFIGIASIIAISASIYAWWCDKTATKETRDAEEAEKRKKEEEKKNA